MSHGQRSTLLAYLRRLVGAAATDDSDAELLERFAAQRDETAFEALMHRHGPLVWNVCRRVLAEEHAAEDAFQATFLVLVRKAQSVSKKASIRSWLYGVALRVALRARQQETLRRRREQETPVRQNKEADWQDLRPILDEEIQRLPEKYRLPIILCYLEGQTNDEAARLLNCPRGTIAIRLSRARERLRSRLLRRGVALPAATLTALLTDNAMSAAAPALLLAQTMKFALMGTASGSIITLTEGVLHAMFVNKLKMTSAFVLMLAALGGAGAGVYYLRAQVPVPIPDERSQKLEPKEATKPEAAKDTKPARDFALLLKARVAAAEKAYRAEFEGLRRTKRAGNVLTPITQNPEDVYTWSVRWLQAQRALSPKHEDQVAALEDHFKRMTDLEKDVKALVRDFMVPIRAVEAEWYRLEAEIWLAEVKNVNPLAK